MKIDNILTSNFHFAENETLLKYRFKLINSMFLAGILFATIAGILRFFMGHYAAGILDFTMVFSFLISFFYLRSDKKVFDTVSSMQMSIVFILFTLITVALKDDHTKLLWYALAITVTYMLKGIKAGLTMTVATIAMLTILYIIPSVDLSMSSSELIISFLFYITLSVFIAFSAMQQQMSLDNVRQANSKIKKQQLQLHKQLRTNPSTNLPNTLALKERLSVTKCSVSLISLKIDDFIQISNIFGHDKAMLLITEIAKMLQRFQSEYIELYHTESEQFSFLIKKFENTSDISLAKEIKTFFDNRSIIVGEIEISISFSMGIARGEKQKLLVNANAALYEAMNECINGYKLFKLDKKKETDQKNNLYWNSKIKEVISQGNLRVYYQPIVNNKSRKTDKYECLIRAIDNDKIIPPFLFLQAAKSRGMLPNITRVVIEESFKLFSTNDLKFSINITDDDLKHNYLVRFLNKMSRMYNISPNRVYLEVLENITSTKSYDAIKQFEVLKKMGYQIAIDDFGTEASNFSRLMTLDADIIKIDGQFIKNLDTDTNSVKIVETIVSLAKKLEAKTVAEFVHSEEIYKIVTELGVDYSQGYYFSPPLPKIETSTAHHAVA